MIPVKGRHVEEWNRIENPETSTQLIFDKGAKNTNTMSDKGLVSTIKNPQNQIIRKIISGDLNHFSKNI